MRDVLKRFLVEILGYGDGESRSSRFLSGTAFRKLVNTCVANGNQRFHHAAKRVVDAAGKSTAPVSVTLVGRSRRVLFPYQQELPRKTCR